MSFDKGDNESNQKYMKRKLPAVLKALTNINGLGEASIVLFDQKKIYWYGDLEDLESEHDKEVGQKVLEIGSLLRELLAIKEG